MLEYIYLFTHGLSYFVTLNFTFTVWTCGLVNKFDMLHLRQWHIRFTEKLCMVNRGWLKCYLFTVTIYVKSEINQCSTLMYYNYQGFRGDFVNTLFMWICISCNATYIFFFIFIWSIAFHFKFFLLMHTKRVKLKLEAACIAYYRWYGTGAAATIDRNDMLGNVYAIHNLRAMYFRIVEYTQHIREYYILENSTEIYIVFKFNLHIITDVFFNVINFLNFQFFFS